MKDTRNTGKNPQSLAERVHRMTKELHLPGFRQRMEETLEDATWQQMTSLEQIYDLLNAEIVRREANTAVKLRRHSNLPLDLINARFEELYESDNRRWDTRLMALVRDGQWMLRETPAVVRGRQRQRTVFALPKLTIPDDKVLLLEIIEKNGARHQTVEIAAKELLEAKLL